MQSEDVFWAVAQVYSNQEQRAIVNLRRQEFKCFFPFFFETTEKKQTSTVPLFPGYVFVEINPEQPWGLINNTYGVIRLLTTKRNKEVIVDRVPSLSLQPFLRLLIANPFKEVRIPLNSVVRIRRGAFADNVAVVKLSKEEKRVLLFQFLGREVEFEFQDQDVEVV
jgi:transcription antitermination factor NusG